MRGKIVKNLLVKFCKLCGVDPEFRLYDVYFVHYILVQIQAYSIPLFSYFLKFKRNQ